MLFDRDYTNLTDEEIQQLNKAEEFRKKLGNMIRAADAAKYRQLKPDAAYYFESLFPNNYLFINDLKDYQNLEFTTEQFADLIQHNPSERLILEFINRNRYYFLVGSILKGYYSFGHHGAYLFKEFELPPNFVADYLIIGENSAGYHFVFTEFENSHGTITNVDGTFGTTIRKGIKQIDDWDEWIESNFSHLKLMFQKYLGPGKTLPNEFISLDKTRIHYTLVAGRRSNFSERTYRQQRKLKQERNINLIHYDNLIENIQLFKTIPNY